MWCNRRSDYGGWRRNDGLMSWCSSSKPHDSVLQVRRFFGASPKMSCHHICIARRVIWASHLSVVSRRVISKSHFEKKRHLHHHLPVYDDHGSWATRRIKIRKVLSLYNFKAWERNGNQQTKGSIYVSYTVYRASELLATGWCLPAYWNNPPGSTECSLSFDQNPDFLSYSPRLTVDAPPHIRRTCGSRCIRIGCLDSRRQPVAVASYWLTIEILDSIES
jgi:hypothetical protein